MIYEALQNTEPLTENKPIKHQHLILEWVKCSRQREAIPDHKVLRWKWSISRWNKWMEDKPTAWIEVVSEKPAVVPEFSKGEPIQAQTVGKSEAPWFMA